MKLEPGLWVTPRVRLVRQLTAGGMGQIWIAAHLRLHTQVVVKFLSPELTSNAGARARFDREARVVGQIESPHLVQVYEHGTLPDSTPFIVMEWLEGETLHDHLERVQVLSAQHTVSVTTQIARALQKAHEAGVVHRDIKPQNVFLLRSQSAPSRPVDLLVKVLDFGVAKLLGEGRISVVTDTGATLGTPSYMSPEQLRSAANVDARSDIWALGVLAYRMLLGRHPYEANDYPSLCLAICQATYKPPSQLDRRWPAPVDRWFARVFAVDRDKRFASAMDAAHSFAAAVGMADDDSHDLAATLPVGKKS